MVNAMMSGREALASIDRAAQQVRGDETRMEAMLRELSDAAAKEKTQQADVLTALARLRLDAVKADGAAAAVMEAERRALSLIEEARREAEGVARARADAMTEEARVEAVRDAAASALDAASAALDARVAGTEARLKDDPAWRALAGRVESAENVADEADAKADTAEADLADKRRPYEADPLFLYLWRRGYGTQTYRSTGLIKSLDAWVARLVRYDGARANYHMLNEIPVRLRAHAEAKLAEARSAQEELAALERAALLDDGVGPLEAAVTDARAALETAQRDVDAAIERVKALDARHEALIADGGSGARAKAMAGIAAALAQTGIAALAEEARRTPTPEDDRLVARLAEIDERLKRLEGEIAETRATARELARRRGEIETAREEFRTKGYDRPDAGFSNGDMIGQILAGIVAGALRRSDLGRVLGEGLRRSRSYAKGWDFDFDDLEDLFDDDRPRRKKGKGKSKSKHRRRFPKDDDDGFGGLFGGLGGFGGGFGGGGFGGGGFRGGGGFGGGGFKTGGGF